MNKWAMLGGKISHFGSALCSVDRLKQLVMKRGLWESALKTLAMFSGAVFVEELKKTSNHLQKFYLGSSFRLGHAGLFPSSCLIHTKQFPQHPFEAIQQWGLIVRTAGIESKRANFAFDGGC